MLEYFGEKPEQPCGKCDECRAAAAELSAEDREAQILYLASQPGGHTIDYIASQLSVPVAKVIESARPLLDEGTVVLKGSTLVLPS